ncbi:MAG: serine/threonine-protein kinase [Deltaproteobacteria bacterium]|jgi:serine/threonine protein kinase|nr:serine/threonine-protein kinase [Deltaproteobacteria bacterium]
MSRIKSSPFSNITKTINFPDNIKIEKEIGSGGIAKIYRAYQTDLKRIVAVKVLTIPTEEQIMRFKREARLLASLQHENLIHVYRLHSSKFNHYIIMEHVEGFDLTELLESEETFPPEVAASIALLTCRALSYIHNFKIIHRDIKPGNIMLTIDGNVKLMDFGIARKFDNSDDKYSTMNFYSEDDRGKGIGTPNYISPEQLRGDPLDGRADIYSLGVVLFRMLTGVKPFVYKSEDTLFNKIQHTAPMPPKSLVPEIPKTLNKIIIRCLKKNKEERYKNGLDLQIELEKFLRTKYPKLKFNQRLIEFLYEKKKISQTRRDRILKTMDNTPLTLQSKIGTVLISGSFITGLSIICLLEFIIIIYLLVS